MLSFNIAPFHLYDKEHEWQYNVIPEIYDLEYFYCMCMTDYPFQMNKFCCHGPLLLWQLQYFMNIGYLSNTVAMVTFTRFLLKIPAHLIDKICYYASHMAEPFLNDSKKCFFLTLFKCVLLKILQNVVRSLLSAGGPNIVMNGIMTLYVT